MTKLSIALLGLFLLVPLPLRAASPPASETHVFEFDYDHQIEAPVLHLPTNAAASPPEAEETPAPPPLKPAEAAEIEETPPSIDSLFSPSEAERPEKTADAAKAEAPEKIEIEYCSQAAEKLEKETAAAEAAKEEAKVSPAPPLPKKPVAEARRSRAESGRAAVAAKSGESFLRDPRRRFWLLASRTWNLSPGRFYRPAAGPVIDVAEFPPAAPRAPAHGAAAAPPNRAGVDLADLRNFPNLQ